MWLSPPSLKGPENAKSVKCPQKKALKPLAESCGRSGDTAVGAQPTASTTVATQHAAVKSTTTAERVTLIEETEPTCRWNHTGLGICSSDFSCSE
jgi:hypothetical protein